jgi:queuine/archaeosine tRNA-ribosyltransferase
MYGLPDDDLRKIETGCRCNVLIMKLRTDIMHLVAYNTSKIVLYYISIHTMKKVQKVYGFKKQLGVP